MTASDKLLTWLLEKQPDRILQLLPELTAAGVADGEGGPNVTAADLRARSTIPLKPCADGIGS